jgi:hypothetical protein
LFPIPEQEITHAIDVSRYLDYKLTATRCHKSQSQLWENLQSVEGGVKSFWQREYFAQLWPQPGSRDAFLEHLEAIA